MISNFNVSNSFSITVYTHPEYVQNNMNHLDIAVNVEDL